MAIVAVGFSEGVFSVVGDDELISAGDPSKAKEKLGWGTRNYGSRNLRGDGCR
jgi:hypothetical protein